MTSPSVSRPLPPLHANSRYGPYGRNSSYLRLALTAEEWATWHAHPEWWTMLDPVEAKLVDCFEQGLTWAEARAIVVPTRDHSYHCKVFATIRRAIRLGPRWIDADGNWKI